jgi:DNA-binding CsgD family transcriptional regulator
MHPPILVREPSAEERARLEAALRAAHAFTVRRARIVLLSADGHRPRGIARGLRCAVRTARDGVRAFDAAGLRAPEVGSSRPRSAAPVLGEAGLGEAGLDEAGLGRPRTILHQQPRAFGHARGTWTLALLARVAEPDRAVGRDGPAGAAAAGGRPEGGRALADQPRPRPRAKKTRPAKLAGGGAVRAG